MRAAASRTFWTAGNRSPIKIAMIAITTNNSISVNADERLFKRECMADLMKRTWNRNQTRQNVESVNNPP